MIKIFDEIYQKLADFIDFIGDLWYFITILIGGRYGYEIGALYEDSH